MSFHRNFKVATKWSYSRLNFKKYILNFGKSDTLFVSIAENIYFATFPFAIHNFLCTFYQFLAHWCFYSRYSLNCKNHKSYAFSAYCLHSKKNTASLTSPFPPKDEMKKKFCTAFFRHFCQNVSKIKSFSALPTLHFFGNPQGLDAMNLNPHPGPFTPLF